LVPVAGATGLFVFMTGSVTPLETGVTGIFIFSITSVLSYESKDGSTSNFRLKLILLFLFFV
jgi:hypothetical protein